MIIAKFMFITLLYFWKTLMHNAKTVEAFLFWLFAYGHGHMYGMDDLK